jgi:KEOPS complex subunit Cgi121
MVRTGIPHQVSQHSIVSGEYMKTPQATHEIRQATITVDDRDAFLRIIQAIAQSNSTHIVCFDADKLAGRDHAAAALQHAHRSFFSERPISNSFEMEALLFASGSRQCLVAALFGIQEGENRMFVCSSPVNEDIWKDLSPYMHFVTQSWDEMTPDKEARLMTLFGITQEELDVVGQDRLKDLILERIALLHINR